MQAVKPRQQRAQKAASPPSPAAHGPSVCAPRGQHGQAMADAKATRAADVAAPAVEATQHQQDRQDQSTPSSHYRGVSWDKRQGKWTAQIKHNRRKQHLGSFAEEEAAARAYDAQARRVHGAAARVNFPHVGEQEAARRYKKQDVAKRRADRQTKASGPAFMCEDCRKVGATFGMSLEGKRRWCSACSKRNHPGAVSLLKSRMCERCRTVRASVPRKASVVSMARRWCIPCGRVVLGDEAVGTYYCAIRKMCADCGVRRAVVGRGGHKSCVWCQRCSRAHGDANPAPATGKRNMCEDCGVKLAILGLPGGLKRWCHKCSHGHPGAQKSGLADGRRKRKAAQTAIEYDSTLLQQRMKAAQHVDCYGGDDQQPASDEDEHQLGSLCETTTTIEEQIKATGTELRLARAAKRDVTPYLEALSSLQQQLIAKRAAQRGQGAAQRGQGVVGDTSR
eukprot:COSAG01_NODE_1444_length_10282_cov_17.103506_7_plen_450_part_00